MTPQTAMTSTCLLLIAAGLCFGPDAVSDRIRGSINDLLRPGLEFVRTAKESLTEHSENEFLIDNETNREQIDQLTHELAIAQEKNRALQICLAQQAEQQAIAKVYGPKIEKSHRLIQPELIEAGVLGDTIADEWCQGKMIDTGSKSGLREKELVLSSRKSKKTLIDIGEVEKLSTEDSLLLGLCVIGKVEHVGRWTSSIQLVTDARYTGRAQLIRETTNGFVFDSTEGIILKGQGSSLCRLEGVPAENSVRVHDSVFTKERDGMMSTPLFYGEVVEASLEPNDREWTVLVKPATLPSRLTRIHVLRMIVNQERLASK